MDRLALSRHVIQLVLLLLLLFPSARAAQVSSCRTELSRLTCSDITSLEGVLTEARDLDHITYLELSNFPLEKKVSELLVSKLTRLQSLKLRNVTIYYPQLLSSLTTLHHLDASGCGTELIDNGHLNNLQSLKTINFAGNEITSLDANQLDVLSSLEQLFLHDNTFTCNCDLLVLSEWLDSPNANRLLDFNHNPPICASPAHLRGSAVVSLHRLQSFQESCRKDKGRRNRQRRNSADEYTWSCTTRVQSASRVILFTASTLSILTNSDCHSSCLLSGHEYYARAGTTCHCGNALNPVYNKGGCQLRCTGANPDSKGCDDDTFISVDNVFGVSPESQVSKSLFNGEVDVQVKPINESRPFALSISYFDGVSRRLYLLESDGTSVTTSQGAVVVQSDRIILPSNVNVTFAHSQSTPSGIITWRSSSSGVVLPSVQSDTCLMYGTSVCTTFSNSAIVSHFTYTANTAESMQLVTQYIDANYSTQQIINLSFLASLDSSKIVSQTLSPMFISVGDSKVFYVAVNATLSSATWRRFDGSTFTRSCSSICPSALIGDLCNQIAPVPCYLAENMTFSIAGPQIVDVDLKSAIIRATYNVQWKPMVQHEISYLRINPLCSQQIVATEQKSFRAVTDGTDVLYDWFLDDALVDSTGTSVTITVETITSYNLRVIAKNEVSSGTTNRTFSTLTSGLIHGLKFTVKENRIAEGDLKCLSLQNGVAIVAAGAITSFRASVCGRSQAFVYWSFGDNGSDSASLSSPVNHIYNVPGQYIATAFANNSVNNMSETKTVVVYANITYFHVNFNKLIGRTGELLTIEANATKGVGACFAHSYVTNTWQDNSSMDGKVSINITLFVPGKYRICVEVQNPVSRQQMCENFEIQEVIALIWTPKLFAITGENVEFDPTRLSGTDTRYSWNYGDGTTTPLAFTANTPAKTVHSFPSEGDFNVTLSYYNNVTAQSQLFHTIGIRHSVVGFRIENPKYVRVNELVNFRLIFPFNTSYSYNYEGYLKGHTSLSHSVERRVLSQAGVEHITGRVWNEASSALFFTTVFVQSEVRRLYLDPLYAMVNSSVTLIPDKGSGTNVSFSITFPDTSVVNGSSIPYTFTQLGMADVKLTGWNEISSIQSQFNINVEANLSLANVVVSGPSQTVAPNRTVILVTGIQKASSVVSSWYADPAIAWIINADETMAQIRFFSAGRHEVHLNMTNDVSATQIVKSFDVEEQVGEIGVMHNGIRYLDGELLVTATGAAIAKAEVDSGTGLEYLWRLNGFPVAPAVQATLDLVTPGVYVLNLTVKNRVSSKSIQIQIHAIQLLGSLTLHTNGTDSTATQQYFATDNGVEFSAMLGQGTNVTYIWTVDGTEVKDDPSSGFSTHFARPGVYIVSVNVSNDVTRGSLVASITVFAQARISDLRVKPSEVLIGIPSYLNASVVSGTNVTYRWQVLSSSGPNNPFLFTAPGVGPYTVTVTAQNEVSNSTIRFLVTGRQVLSKIPTISNVKAVVTNGTVTIQADTSQQVTFTWFVNGVEVANETGKSLNYPFDQPGVYTVSMKATNGLSSSDLSNVVITVQDPPQAPVIDNCCNIPLASNSTLRLSGGVEAGTNVTFMWIVKLPGREVFTVNGSTANITPGPPGIATVELVASNAVDTVSVKYNVTILQAIEGFQLWASQETVPRGEEVTFMALTQAGSSIDYTWLVNDAVVSTGSADSISKTMDVVGNYTITLRAINGLLSTPMIKSVVVSVQPVSCPPPVLSIQGSVKRRMTMSTWLYAEAKVNFNCTIYAPASSWTFRIATEAARCQFDYALLDVFQLPVNDVVVTSPLLSVPPGSFPVGNYCVLYSMVYGASMQYERVIAMRLEVISTPLVPQIIGGSRRKFSTIDEVIINGSLTIDPDISVSEAPLLEFRWLSDYVSSSVGAPSTIRLNTTWSNSSFAVLPPSNILPGFPYRVDMFVRRRGSVDVSRSSQTVTTELGSVPLVVVTCVTCQAYKTLKYTSRRQLKMDGQCTNCGGFGPSLLNYEWTVLDSNGAKVQLGKDDTETGMTSRFLIINADVLDGLQDYEFQLQLYLGTAVGESSTTLFPNPAPRNGSCHVTPTKGHSLQTMFTFACSGWQDEDNVDVPLLTWVISTVGSQAIVYRGIQSNVSSTLRVGSAASNRMVRITILIEDSLGAIAIGHNGTVQVYPPTDIGDVQEFLKSKVQGELAALAKAKDSNKVLAFVQSGAALVGNNVNQNEIVSRMVKSAADIQSSSLEGIEQISTTVNLAVQSGDENAVDLTARTSVTNTLDNIIAKLSRFAESGIPASYITTKALYEVFANNFVGIIGLNDTSNRARRATDESLTSSLLTSTNANLIKFYTSLLQTKLRGEKPQEFTSKNMFTRLHRVSPNDVLAELSRRGCAFKKDIEVLDGFSDIFEVFESSAVDQYSPTNIVPTSQLCRLAYFQPDRTAIQVKNLPLNETIEIAIDQNSITADPGNYSVVLNASVGEMRNGDLQLDDVVIGEAIHVEVSYLAAVANGELKIELFHRNTTTAISSNNTQLLQSKMLYAADGTFSFFVAESTFDPTKTYFIRVTNNFTSTATITFSLFTSSCLYWNHTLENWDRSGCTVSNASSRHQTKCHCNHLTSFSALLKLKPNPIDFSLLLELDIADNPVALIACLTVIALFFIVLLVSYRIDEKERRHEHFIPFLGPDEFFKYEIKVTTGGQIGAGTTARVGIQIFGRRAKTKPRLLFKEGGLQRNSIDIFQFASSKGLGNIHRIRVWHDNSGGDPSWHVRSIIIKNLLSGRKYFFFCNSWLALDTEDGVIEKDFTVASKKRIRQFSLIFDNVVGRAFHDYHLWFSVLQRPTLSSFTRVQRVTCCVTLVLSYMAINAMWFGVAPDGEVDVFLGFRGFSYEEVFIGVISSLMVFPLNIGLMMLFRKSKPNLSQGYDDSYGEVTIHTMKRKRRYSLESIEIDDLRRHVDQSECSYGASLRRCKTRINVGAFRLPLFHTGDPYYAVLPEHNIGEFDPDQPVLHDPEAIEDMDIDDTPTLERANEPPPLHNTDLDLDTPLMPAPPIDNDPLISRTKTHDEQMAENFELFSRAVAHARRAAQAVKGPDRTKQSIERANDAGVKETNEETEQEMRRLFHQFYSASISDSGTPSERGSDGEHNVDPENSIQRRKYLEEMDDLPDVFERPANMHGPLPSWCSLVAYFLSLALSGFSIVLILIYGQDFGKDKALKWLTALAVGLLQDVFITYPVVLVTGAAILAFFVKPSNLDYSDFVDCPVVPRVPKLKDNIVNPLRGLALKSAQREGRRKHRLRSIIKQIAFLLVFGWLLMSVFVISFNPTTAQFKVELEKELDSGNISFTSVKSSSEYWAWSDARLIPFLESHEMSSAEWGVVGSARLRQLRINTSIACSSSAPTPCHIHWTSSNAQTNDANRDWSMPLPSHAASSHDSAWSYTTNSGSRRSFQGTYQAYEMDRGYVYTFPSPASSATASLSTLKDHHWIDRRSSAVFIEFVLQNRNISDTYAVFTLLMENSLSGFVSSRIDIQFVIADMYTRNLDYFRLICEVILSIFMTYLGLKIWLQIRKYGCHGVVRRFWFWHLACLFTISLTYMIMAVYRVAMLANFRSDLKDGFPISTSPSLPAAIESAIVILLGAVSLLIILKAYQLVAWLRNYILISYSYRKAVGYLFATAFIVVLIGVGFTSYGYVVFDYSYRYQGNPFDSFFGRLLLAWQSETRWHYASYHDVYGVVWNIFLYSVYFSVLVVLLMAFAALVFKRFHLAYPRQAEDRDRSLSRYIWSKIRGQRHLSDLPLPPDSNSAALSSTDRVLFTQSRLFSSCQSPWRYQLTKPETTATGQMVDSIAFREQEEIRRDEFFSAMDRQLQTHPHGLRMTETPL